MVVTDVLHRVTGALTPDATGNYNYAIQINGKSAYMRDDAAWWIAWDNIDSWLISQAPGLPALPRWKRTDPNIEGNYEPDGGAIGIATVTEI